MVSSILDKFEASFERLVEGSVGRVFKTPVQPAEIGRKLERAMVSNQVVSVDSTLVPNDYHVMLNPQDLIQFSDLLPGLCHQMESWLTDVADMHGFRLIDQTRVLIVGEDSVPRRAIQVTAAISDKPNFSQKDNDELQRTELYRIVAKSSGVQPLRFKFNNGPQAGVEYLLKKSVTSLGRALDNDIVLESSEVSRHHARIELQTEGMRIIDLNSTNGTRVNGRSVRSQALDAGDEITFGNLSAKIIGDEQKKSR
jgi:pSer/pThr/pTyr-binding forkhead associated (FHA) protein